MKFMIVSILLLGIASFCCAEDIADVPFPLFPATKPCGIPKCTPGCISITPFVGCSICSCRKKRQVACTPPRCAEGCFVNYKAVPCPSCMCPKK